MAKKKSNNTGKIFILSAVAGAVGYGVGLLTSPRSGKQNRLKVKRAAKKSKKVTEKELKKVQKELTDAITASKRVSKRLSKKAQGEYGLLMDKASNSKETVVEVIGAVKEGKAKNKDLDSAVKEAKSSVVHLKDFIKRN